MLFHFVEFEFDFVAVMKSKVVVAVMKFLLLEHSFDSWPKFSLILDSLKSALAGENKLKESAPNLAKAIRCFRRDLEAGSVQCRLSLSNSTSRKHEDRLRLNSSKYATSYLHYCCC